MAEAHSELYVSPDLDTWEAHPPIQADQDQVCERCGYRRLDPEYYAWLRYRMSAAQRAVRAGRLPEIQFQEWRTRFNAVHAWALRRFGEQPLLAAVKALDPKQYRPPEVEEYTPAAPPEPVAHQYPAEGEWPFTQRVTPEAVGKVEAIRERALSLGWTEAGLYQNRGRLRYPAGEEYGLVCLLQAGAEIGEVSAQSIEIISRNGSRSRYYSRAVPQPWIRPVAPEKEHPQ